jgi:hypothetical protein
VGFFRPFGACWFWFVTHGLAVGCVLAPLRGWACARHFAGSISKPVMQVVEKAAE